MKKPVEDRKREGAGEGYAISDQCMLAGYPQIMQYLGITRWDDGTPRETSQLAIGFHDEGLRLSLNDRDLKQSVYTQGDTLVECLDLLEGALRSDAVRWYKWNRGKKAK